MNIGIIFAGGVGTRMQSGDLPKQFLKVHGKPIIVHTLEVFQAHSGIDGIIVSCVPDWISHLNGLRETYRLTKIHSVVSGGKTGQESIFNGLVEAERLFGVAGVTVLIHDGVRPLLDAATISRNISSVEEHGSAITCVPAKETVVKVDASGMVEGVMERSESLIARAPQSFFLVDILQAHRKARAEGRNDFIDSCTLMSHYGFGLSIVPGEMSNIKVTTPDDYYMLRAVFDAREDVQLAPEVR